MQRGLMTHHEVVQGLAEAIEHEKRRAEAAKSRTTHRQKEKLAEKFAESESYLFGSLDSAVKWAKVAKSSLKKKDYIEASTSIYNVASNAMNAAQYFFGLYGDELPSLSQRTFKTVIGGIRTQLPPPGSMSEDLEHLDEVLWSRAGGRVGHVPGMSPKDVPKANHAINAMVKAANEVKAEFSSYKKNPENLSPVVLYKSLMEVLKSADWVAAQIWRGPLPKDLPDYSDPNVYAKEDLEHLDEATMDDAELQKHVKEIAKHVDRNNTNYALWYIAKNVLNVPAAGKLVKMSLAISNLASGLGYMHPYLIKFREEVFTPMLKDAVVKRLGSEKAEIIWRAL